MEQDVISTLQYIRSLTKDWERFSSASESYATPLTACLLQKKTGCGMKARFAQLLLTLLGYEVAIVRGYFRSPERWTLHVWIRVNGKEFDPSVGDFHVTPDRHSYTNPDPKLRNWEQIVPPKSSDGQSS